MQSKNKKGKQEIKHRPVGHHHDANMHIIGVPEGEKTEKGQNS